MANPRNYANTATEAQVVGPLSPTDTTITLASFAGYPPAPFAAAIERSTASEEVVLVTAVAGTTVTVIRGYDGTVAVSHPAGSQFLHVAIARDYTEAASHVQATTGVHGTTGELVGTTSAQTLSNKTLETSTLVEPAAVGGTFTTPVLEDPTVTTDGVPVSWRWRQLTQTEYDALEVKDPATMYAIVGD